MAAFPLSRPYAMVEIPVAASPGDCDCDGIASLADYACFEDCLNGPE